MGLIEVRGVKKRFGKSIILENIDVDIKENDTLESVMRRGLQIEHQLYAETLEKIFFSAWDLEPTDSGRRRFRWL